MKPTHEEQIRKGPDNMKEVAVSLLETCTWLSSRTDAMVNLLERFVNAESPSLDKAAVDRFGRIVEKEWKRRGARVARLPQAKRGDVIRVEWNPRGSRSSGQILVLGHLDTVYETGTLARTPFRVSRGRAWGPGTLDMKGGLMLALFAVDALRATRTLPQKRIIFLWTSDEEIGSGASRRTIEREANRSQAVLVLEPAAGIEGSLKTGRKGLGEIEIIATGRAAHAGLNPEKGVNAVEEIARQIARFTKWNDPRRGITVSAGIVEGGTRVNVIPDSARVQVDVRASRISDMRALEHKFHALKPILAGAKVEVRGGFNRPPLERKTSAALFAFARRLASEMDVRLGEAFVGGGSDGNFTSALGVPTLDGLGPVGDGAHSPGEHVVISRLAERAALLAGLLATL